MQQRIQCGAVERISGFAKSYSFMPPPAHVLSLVIEKDIYS